MKRKFLILLYLILFFVSVAGVSAAEDVNQTIIEDTNNVVSTGDTLSVSASENVNQTIDDALSVSEYVDVISAKDDGTFTALQKKIMDAPEGSTIYLENDYYYDEGFSTDGILIENEGLTIDGKGHTLNGMSKSRIFHFYSSSSSNHYAVLKNITFYNGYTESDGGALYPETNYYKRSEFDSWGEACYWNLEVNNCVFYNNAAAESGGAIYDGQLTITDSSFINNVAYFTTYLFS